MTRLQGYIMQCADFTLLVYSEDEKTMIQYINADIGTVEINWYI